MMKVLSQFNPDEDDPFGIGNLGGLTLEDFEGQAEPTDTRSKEEKKLRRKLLLKRPIHPTRLVRGPVRDFSFAIERYQGDLRRLSKAIINELQKYENAFDVRDYGEEYLNIITAARQAALGLIKFTFALTKVREIYEKARIKADLGYGNRIIQASDSDGQLLALASSIEQQQRVIEAQVGRALMMFVADNVMKMRTRGRTLERLRDLLKAAANIVTDIVGGPSEEGQLSGQLEKFDKMAEDLIRYVRIRPVLRRTTKDQGERLRSLLTLLRRQLPVWKSRYIDDEFFNGVNTALGLLEETREDHNEEADLLVNYAEEMGVDPEVLRDVENSVTVDPPETPAAPTGAVESPEEPPATTAPTERAAPRPTRAPVQDANAIYARFTTEIAIPVIDSRIANNQPALTVNQIFQLWDTFIADQDLDEDTIPFTTQLMTQLLEYQENAREGSQTRTQGPAGAAARTPQQLHEILIAFLKDSFIPWIKEEYPETGEPLKTETLAKLREYLSQRYGNPNIISPEMVDFAEVLLVTRYVQGRLTDEAHNQVQRELDIYEDSPIDEAAEEKTQETLWRDFVEQVGAPLVAKFIRDARSKRPQELYFSLTQGGLPRGLDDRLRREWRAMFTAQFGIEAEIPAFNKEPFETIWAMYGKEAKSASPTQASESVRDLEVPVEESEESYPELGSPKFTQMLKGFIAIQHESKQDLEGKIRILEFLSSRYPTESLSDIEAAIDSATDNSYPSLGLIEEAAVEADLAPNWYESPPLAAMVARNLPGNAIEYLPIAIRLIYKHEMEDNELDEMKEVYRRGVASADQSSTSADPSTTEEPPTEASIEGIVRTGTIRQKKSLEHVVKDVQASYSAKVLLANVDWEQWYKQPKAQAAVFATLVQRGQYEETSEDVNRFLTMLRRIYKIDTDADGVIQAYNDLPMLLEQDMISDISDDMEGWYKRAEDVKEVYNRLVEKGVLPDTKVAQEWYNGIVEQLRDKGGEVNA